MRSRRGRSCAEIHEQLVECFVLLNSNSLPHIYLTSAFNKTLLLEKDGERQSTVSCKPLRLEALRNKTFIFNHFMNSEVIITIKHIKPTLKNSGARPVTITTFLILYTEAENIEINDIIENHSCL